MSCPLYPPSTGYFYPLGNTPAISLTQDISPEQPADILLLGCGDPRNILYTLYADVVVSSSPRKLDITCCDIEPAVLARNILLFTLVEAQEPLDRVWDIFYHFKIDDQAMEILARQSQRLYDNAQSIETWRQSSYGSFLNFIDTRTLRELRRHWGNYAGFANLPTSRLDKLRQEQARFSQSILENKPPNIGPSRSAGMRWLQAATPLADLYKHYWKTGTISMLNNDIEKARNLNPTFVYSAAGEVFNPYDGTFPQGFHLIPAFASISSDPMDPRASGNTPSPTGIYKRQFRAWCNAFRKSRVEDCITLRFYAGDAVTFCRALDIYASTGSAPVHLFTSAWRADRIDLSELAASVPSAILKFDVIETSNIMDHIGFLNLLLITRPLLKENPRSKSVLYTEQLLASDENGVQPFSERICATVPTVLALFGLAPLDWVSGFTSHSNVHEPLAGVTQSIERIAWVDPMRGDYYANSSRPVVSFQADDLARIMFGVYERIFKYEQDMSGFLLNISRGRLHSMATTHHHRESVASLFQLVKRRVCLKTGTWDLVEEKFLDAVRRDRSRKVGMRFYEDLRLHLHLYGIHAAHIPRRDLRGAVSPVPPPGGLANQSNVPPIICVVFTIPRTRLQVLLRDNSIATPTLQCNLGAIDGGVVAFSAIHAIWGKTVANPGTKTTIEEDPRGMKGESDLVVLFWVPNRIILGDISSISLAFKPTLHAGIAYLNTLGPEMELFSAHLDDEKYVKMFPYWPTATPENPPTAQHTIVQFPTPNLSDSSAIILAVTGQAQDESSVVSLTARVEIVSPSEQQTLLDGANVTATQISPCTMKLSIADYDHLVSYSYPVLGACHKLRVARKSRYVEIIVPVSEPLDAGGYSLDRTPILRHNEYSPWNLHHIHVDRMPLLDVVDRNKLGWINDHTGLQLSERERAIMSGEGDTKDSSSKLLAAIKDTIHSLVNHYSGAWKRKGSAFGFCEPSEDMYALLLVGGLRLDLASFTIVVDTAIIPLAHRTADKVFPLLRMLERAKPILKLTAMDDEAIAWRKLLPAFVERSRTWSHKPNCEYESTGKVPVDLRLGENPICSCGEGIGFDAAEWKVPVWQDLLPFATRAAISPLFSVPYIESVARMVEDLQRGVLGMPDAGAANRLQLWGKCWGCGDAGKPDLRVCSRCKRARYCSATCQRQNWKLHKTNCKAA